RIAGGTIAYNVAGRGATILLLHGLYASKEQWSALACQLAERGYRTIAVDLPGYGKSDGYAITDYRLESQVGKLHSLLGRLGVASFHLAGNSMGGAIAALYADRYPREVESLAFIGSPLGIVDWNRGVREAIYRGVNPFIPVDERELDLEMGLLF